MSFCSSRIRNSALFLLLSASAFAQSQSTKPLNIVMPQGKGRIIYSSTPEWSIVNFHLFDKDTRPALHVKNRSTGISVIYSLFRNTTGVPTGEGCRDTVIDPSLRGFSVIGTVKNDRKATYVSASGTPIATSSYLIESMTGTPIHHEQNLFGFLGNASTCAEVQISKADYGPADDVLMRAELDRFHYEPSYQPSTADYFVLATIFFSKLHSPANAVPYYQAAIDSLPHDPLQDADDLKLRRVFTDQLVMSYGTTGDISRSRTVANKAIASDPDYPLNYYNLACGDAEQGDAKNARIHLQQAFDRKANTLPGEKLPDPTKDDSILKLKKDKTFWAFVETLSISK